MKRAGPAILVRYNRAKTDALFPPSSKSEGNVVYREKL